MYTLLRHLLTWAKIQLTQTIVLPMLWTVYGSAVRLVNFFITVSEPLSHSYHIAAKTGASPLKRHRDTMNFPVSLNTHQFYGLISVNRRKHSQSFIKHSSTLTSDDFQCALEPFKYYASIFLVVAYSPHSPINKKMLNSLFCLHTILRHFEKKNKTENGNGMLLTMPDLDGGDKQVFLPKVL